MRPHSLPWIEPNRPLVVGVLGGMGPMATVEAFRRITVATPGIIDQDTSTSLWTPTLRFPTGRMR